MITKAKMNFKITLGDFVKVNPNNSVLLNKIRLDYIEQLRKKKGLTYEKLANQLNCSRKFITKVLKKERNPNILFTQNLAHLFNLNLTNLIEKIYPKFNPKGSYILPSVFPINATAEIASLIGHCFGDAHIGQTFSYTNLRLELIKDVILNVKTLPIINLTMNQRYHKAYTVRFSTLIRDLLLAFGAKKGNKVKQDIRIPNWVKKGSKHIKARFIQALFDDEGTVSPNKRELFFSLSKLPVLQNELYNFFKEICDILTDFLILNPSIRVYYCGEGTKRRVIITVAIHGYNNFLTFENRINFLHKHKRNNLKKIVKNTQHIKLSGEVRDKQFIVLLDKKQMTALDISQLTEMSHKGVLGYLKGMEQRNLIARTKRFYRSGAKWYIVSKKEVK